MNARVDALPAGIHTITAELYHADPCPEPSLSNSLIKLLIGKSPRHAWMAHPRLNPEQRQIEESKFDIGTASHAALLEGLDICEVIDAPDWRTKAAQIARDSARLAGRIPLLPHQHQGVMEMAGAAKTFLVAAGLGSVLDRGKPEQTLIWKDGEAHCRARVDWLTDDRSLILDFKSTGVANPERWMRGAIDLGYDTQDVFYRRGLRKLGFDRARFLFLVQEVSAPYCCYLVELAESARHLAALKVERAINLWSMCLRENFWPGYPTDVHQMEAPPWAIADAEEIE